MRTTKLLLFSALGVGAVLLLTSERARNIRKDLEDKAIENANKLKGKLKNLGSNANRKIDDLKYLLNDDVVALSYDTRMRIENILNRETDGVDKLKNKLA